MEILSDATFKGNVSISGDFSITNTYLPDNPLVNTVKCQSDQGIGLHIYGTEFHRHGPAVFQSTLKVTSWITLNDSSIRDWSDLNNILSFPKPLTFTSPTIPANCTAFEFTSACSSLVVSTDADNLIQVKKASDGKSVIAETWITPNNRPAMSFAGCTSEIPAGTYKAVVF